MADTGISNPVNNCLRLFKLLLCPDNPPSGVAPDKAILNSFQEEQARFKVWVGNIGAHKTGRSSLEYRLRDASHIQKHVIELISDLASSLENARAIILGEKTPWDQLEDDDDSIYDEPSSESDSIDEDFSKTELDQIALNVADIINCLLRLSVAIRNPAPHDRFASSIPAIDTDHYEPFDIQHVQEKFAQVSEGLAMRLGKAISRRRQYFKYRQRHHQKLSEGISAQESIPSNAPKDTVSTIASSIPVETKDAAFNLSRLATVDEDAFSDSGVSQTSFASSVAGLNMLRIPPMPKEAHNGPFECPFCFMMITASTTISWRRHVFGDLRPYICLAEQCADAGREFARRHEWTAHELQNHWKKYLCPAGCNKEFFSVSRCKEHLGEAHPDAIPPNQVDAMITLTSRPLSDEDGIQCPLCQEQLSSFKQYQRHVGRHQEQLALFALPPLDPLDEGDGGENDSDRSEDGESSAEGSRAPDEIVARDDLRTEHQDAGPDPQNTDVPDKAKLSSVDELLLEIVEEPRSIELGIYSQEDIEQFWRQLALDQTETSKDGSAVEVKPASPQICHEPSCGQRQCTSQDEKDPKDSLYCREHVCRVPGCVRFRVKTLDARGRVPVERFETECSEHWVVPNMPGLVRPDEFPLDWEGGQYRRERRKYQFDMDSDEDPEPSPGGVIATDPKEKGKNIAEQGSFEPDKVTQGGDYAQEDSMGASKGDLRSLPTHLQERLRQTLKATIEESGLSTNFDLDFPRIREPRSIFCNEPSKPTEGMGTETDFLAQPGGSVQESNSPGNENEGLDPQGGSEVTDRTTGAPTSMPSVSVAAGDAPTASTQGESIHSAHPVPSEEAPYQINVPAVEVLSCIRILNEARTR